MVAISTGPHVWRPRQMDAATAPTFTYRIPTVTERELFEAGMAVHNATAVYDWNIREQFRAGLAALLPEDPGEAERLIELLTRQQDGDTLVAVEIASLDEAADALRQYWPGYRLLVERAARREHVLPIAAFRAFVVGWEGKVGPDDTLACVRGIDGLIAESVLGRIDPILIRLLGVHLYAEMYGLGEEKNFEAPSKSGGAPKISRKPPKAKRGKSAPTNGRKTRASPSPVPVSPP